MNLTKKDDEVLAKYHDMPYSEELIGRQAHSMNEVELEYKYGPPNNEVDGDTILLFGFFFFVVLLAITALALYGAQNERYEESIIDLKVTKAEGDIGCERLIGEWKHTSIIRESYKRFLLYDYMEDEGCMSPEKITLEKFKDNCRRYDSIDCKVERQLNPELFESDTKRFGKR